VRERLATVYGDEARLSLTAAPGGGTCVALSFPLPA
jgi:sensor histidine kinase YesM